MGDKRRRRLQIPAQGCAALARYPGNPTSDSFATLKGLTRVLWKTRLNSRTLSEFTPLGFDSFPRVARASTRNPGLELANAFGVSHLVRRVEFSSMLSPQLGHYPVVRLT